MITTLYRRISADPLDQRTHTSPFPVTRNEFLEGVVPVDEFFAGEDPELTQVMAEAARKRAARQRSAMLGIDFEYQFLRDWDQEDVA